MKRRLQLVAVLVTSFLAGMPAMAGLACAMRPAAGSACPMDMSNMGSDCPMSRASLQECHWDCCSRPQNVVAAQDVVFFKQRHTAPEPFVIPNWTAGAVQRELAVAVLSVPETSSPPVYILNRVFRI